MNKFKKDDAVICIADKFIFDKHTPFEYHYIELPKKNKIYIIRSVVNTDYGQGIRLKEIKNSKIWHDHGGWQEPIFGSNRFKIKE